MENYSLMGAAAVMKMAVEMAAVSMEKPSGALPRSGRCRNKTLSPGSWLRDGGGWKGAGPWRADVLLAPDPRHSFCHPKLVGSGTRRRPDDADTGNRGAKDAPAKFEILYCARCHRRLKETERDGVKRKTERSEPEVKEGAGTQHTSGRG
ncbi:hypothetical protein QYE76_044120 [Lolium multiflorum]|uniref:Uncharacterized protein n=1 Tax=Lolium multiflorum TaxID=4521 RepID=A0AAD8TKB3_LOLMU|nr:hypothetical protein QYE76_044120 [Lolium multiflorum]